VDGFTRFEWPRFVSLATSASNIVKLLDGEGAGTNCAAVGAAASNASVCGDVLKASASQRPELPANVDFSPFTVLPLWRLNPGGSADAV
jgi:hypothetical protein